MTLLRTVMWGSVIWLTTFLVTLILRGLDVYGLLVVRLPLALLSGFLAYWLAGYLGPRRVRQALTWGLAWLTVNLVLDWLIGRRLNQDLMMSVWQWFSYALILILPIFAIDKHRKEPGVSSLTIG